MRIAVGGIRHETNTFSTLRTRLGDFTVQRGDELSQGDYRGPFNANDIEWLPTLQAGAFPHGLVEKDTYLQLKEELIGALKSALPVDGVYLNLHGAMEVEEIGDGETDLVESVRSIVGEEVLISASLDLHGNISPRLAETTNLMTALRTAPHRDGESTRRRAIENLLLCLRQGFRPVQKLIKIPLLLPGEFAVTEIEPARSLYAMLPEIEAEDGILDASLLIGCAWTDGPFTSASAIVVSESSADLAAQHVNRLADAVWDQRKSFAADTETASVDEAIDRAIKASESTVFISDSGDNITAGGGGDNPLFVERLLAANVSDALVVGIADPGSLSQCERAGIGHRLTLSLGGKLDPLYGKPLEITGIVKHLAGEPGPDLGIFQIDGLDIVITSERKPFLSFADFLGTGINPLSRKIVVLKLGYLFPDLRDQAPRAIMALSPGFTDLRMDALPFKQIRRPIYPLDPNISWHPNA